MKGMKWGVAKICYALLLISLSGLIFPVYSVDKYPTRPIEIVVPYSPGGATDLMGRVIANALNKKWKVPVNVVNKPGGNTLPACMDVYRAKADGYTMLADNQASSSMLENVVKDLPIKVLDRTFIAMIGVAPNVLIVPTESSYKTLNDIIAEAKKDPKTFTWTSIGGAAPQDFTIRQFFKSINVDVSQTKPIMTQGAAQCVTLTAGNHVKLGCGATSSSMPAIQAGSVRPLAITSKTRFPELANVPTTAELGYPAVDCLYWVGISGPPKLPSYIADAWDSALKELMKDSEMIANLKSVKAMPFYHDSKGTREYVIKESQEVKKLWSSKP
jgi:tripartite-type tricarboxylate transporter receptor subunit TctC